MALAFIEILIRRFKRIAKLRIGIFFYSDVKNIYYHCSEFAYHLCSKMVNGIFLEIV